MGDTKPQRKSGGLRQHFVTGLLALLPAAVTLYVGYQIVVFADNLFGVLLPVNIPGLGLLLTLAFITLFGMIVDNFLGRHVVDLLDKGLRRIPLLRTIYDASKQIVTTFAEQGATFRRVVLVPYPMPGCLALGFVVNEEVVGEGGKVGVFVPSTPPTSGVLLFYDPELVQATSLNVEEAMRLLLSGGTLAPRRAR